MRNLLFNLKYQSHNASLQRSLQQSVFLTLPSLYLQPHCQTYSQVYLILSLNSSYLTCNFPVNGTPWFYLFAGDSPARAFEAGNQVNGHYPCSCGIDIRLCRTHANFLKPKYLNPLQRQAVINKTDRWKNRRSGELSVYDNLDVS